MNMKFFLTLAAILISIHTVQAQSFSEWIQQGDSLYDAKVYEPSAKAYEQAFMLKEARATAYYNAACSWSLAGDTTNGIKNLRLAAEKGWINKDWMKRDGDLLSLHGVSGWEEVLEIVQKNIDFHEKDMDKALKAQLEQIYARDQTLRQLLGPAEEKFGKDSEQMKYFWQLISREDSMNELEVESIIEKNGWVGRSLVGGKANTALWLVIQHAPLSTQEKYLPLLKESVQQGESQGSHLALLEDRIRMRNSKPQVYGSQITTNPETGAKEVYQVENPAEINERRASVGLGPIEDYVKRWGIEWKVE